MNLVQCFKGLKLSISKLLPPFLRHYFHLLLLNFLKPMTMLVVVYRLFGTYSAIISMALNQAIYNILLSNIPITLILLRTDLPFDVIHKLL